MPQLPPDHPLTMALDGLNRPQTLAIYYDASRRGPGLLWDWLRRLMLESFQPEPRYTSIADELPDEYRRLAARVVLVWCRMPDRRIKAFYRAVLDHLIPQAGATNDAA